MFTGLVQAIGTVETVEPRPSGGARISIDPRTWAHRPALGESIAVSGCCLTVALDPAAAGGRLVFDAIPETLAKTTLGALRPGSRTNLERSLRVGDLMGGHSVQGHIEGVAEVATVQTKGDYRLRLRPPPELMPCIVPKGSVALDGVSLTIAAADPNEGTFEVALIPTTLELTTLGDLRPGSRVNIETDIQARTLLHVFRNYPQLCGTGILPVSSHGHPAHAQSEALPNQHAERIEDGTAPGSGVVIRWGAYLPHWRREGGIYSVTFRLADSLPASVLRSWIIERDAIVDRARALGRPLSAHELARLHELHSTRIETALDAGTGRCILRQPELARIVADTLMHFHGDRYHLLAWCVMPSHVHVVVHPVAPNELSSILHSWKSFTAKQINRAGGVSGPVWQPEYYDHLVRDDADLARAVRYVLENPEKAGLSAWPWVGMADQYPAST